MAVHAESRSDVLPGQIWIQAATAASVILLAVIAAVVSYEHMHALALRHGEGPWASALIPLSVDGMIVASSMSLLLDSRLGLRGGYLPWALLITGALASLAANIAVAEATVTGRVIAAWPSFALTCSYELLMRQIRQSAASRADTGSRAHSGRTRARQPGNPAPQPSLPSLNHETVPVLSSPAGSPSAAAPASNGDLALRDKAWQWALANRRSDGSLPTGAEVAQQFRRSERWGRLVKSTGLAGQPGTGT